MRMSDFKSIEIHIYIYIYIYMHESHFASVYNSLNLI